MHRYDIFIGNLFPPLADGFESTEEVESSGGGTFILKTFLIQNSTTFIGDRNSLKYYLLPPKKYEEKIFLIKNQK